MEKLNPRLHLSTNASGGSKFRSPKAENRKESHDLKTTDFRPSDETPKPNESVLSIYFVKCFKYIAHFPFLFWPCHTACGTPTRD